MSVAVGFMPDRFSEITGSRPGRRAGLRTVRKRDRSARMIETGNKSKERFSYVAEHCRKKGVTILGVGEESLAINNRDQPDEHERDGGAKVS